MGVYGAKTPLGRRTIVCRLNSVRSCSLMRAQTPSPNSVPLGTTTAARPRRPRRAASQLPHDELQEEQRRLAVCMSSGKLSLMPASSSPPNGGLVRITSTRSLSPSSREL